jgi:hypothetical protein
MLRFRVWGLSAALAAGGGAAAGAAEPVAKPLEQTTLMHKLLGPKTPKPGPRPAPPTITAPLSPEVLADALRAEQDAYLRRVSICTELRRVATDRADDQLLRQADELERQAAALYNARVAGLGVSRVKSPLPNPTDDRAVADLGITPEQRMLSTEVKARKLEAPTAPIPGTTTAQQIREVPQ